MGKSKKSKITDQSRRDFMKQMGLAASVAVPFMSSEVAMGQTTTAPTRVLFVFLQHGWGFDRQRARVTTNSDGTINSFPPSLAAFNQVKDQCVVIDSLRTSYWGNAHDVSYSDILTCAVSPDAPTAGSLGGPFFVPRSASLDWMIGNAVNKNVLRLSNRYASFGASYHPLSFDNNLRSLPFYTNARDAYMAVIDPLRGTVGGGSVDVDNAVNDALLRALGTNGQNFLNRLSGPRREKMQSYISAMNALGNRILRPQSPTNITLPALPGMNLAYVNQMDSYLEMIRVCFALDTHRVAVLGLGEGATNWTWTNGGQTRTGNTFGNDFHQDVAHYNSSTERMAAMHGWTNWYSSKIASFVEQLKNTTDVDGRPMIDNTLIVLTGEVGNGNHDRETFTHVVIGGGGRGRIRRNRVINLPTFDSRNRGSNVWGSRNMNNSLHICDINYMPNIAEHHLADLWVSVARLAGLNINSFGFDVYNKSPIQLT